MTREITVTANGQSGYIKLYPGMNAVKVTYVGGASGVLTPQHAFVKGENGAIDLPDGSSTVSADESFGMLGPGFLSFSASGVSGTIKVRIERAYG
jgi:hypothetical protein